MAYLHFTLTHAESQGQGHSLFHCEKNRKLSHASFRRMSASIVYAALICFSFLAERVIRTKYRLQNKAPSIRHMPRTFPNSMTAFYIVPRSTMLCYHRLCTSVRPSLRMRRNVNGNKKVNLEALILAECISSKSSMFLTFIFKVKDSN